MHDPTWFAQMEREQAEAQDYREQMAYERQQAAAFQAEMATRTSREVRWCCVYCGHEVPDEHSAHCGEVGHTEAITEDE